MLQHDLSRLGIRRDINMTHVKQESLWTEEVASPADARALRPIHYLGSKLRLLDQIRQTLNELAPESGRVVDLFSGSGTVSAALGSSRPVTAVDIQEFSRVLCSALLRPRPLPPDDTAQFEQWIGQLEENQALAWAVAPMLELEDECFAAAAARRHDALSELLDAGAILSHQDGTTLGHRTAVGTAFAATVERLSQHGLAAGPSSVITRYYGGVYFSYAQALQLDAILNAAQRVAKEYRDAILAAVVSAASDVVNSVGNQFAQPIRLRTRGGQAKPHLVGKVLRDRSLSVAESFARWLARYGSLEDHGLPHHAVRQDYAEFLTTFKGQLGGIYADPPYTRDHYSRYYHVLETICLRDEPSVSKSNLGGGGALSRGMYREVRHQSPFCIKSRAPGAFELLFSRARNLDVPLVLSYSPFDKEGGAHPRLMSIQGIVTLARRHYANVELLSVGRFAHSKFNAARHALNASEEAEVLVLCLP